VFGVRQLMKGAVLIMVTQQGACMDHLMHGKSAAEVFSDPRLARLARASCDGATDQVAAAVAEGANPNGTGTQGETPLVWAVDCQNAVGAEALLRAGANPNYLWSGHVTPTFMAATRKNSAVLEVLLRHGGDPNTQSGDGDSALMGALSLGINEDYWDNYNLLLRRGADINRPDGSGLTIVDNAAALYRYDKVAELLEMGYRGDLTRLGRLVQGGVVAPASPQGEWERRVRAMLERRGIVFPIPPLPIPAEGTAGQ
jgi:ankyrin repeat protein